MISGIPSKVVPVASTIVVLVTSLFITDEARCDWLSTVRLTWADGGSYLSDNNAHCLAADPGAGVHLVWYDNRDGSREIYYSRFDGFTWASETSITASGSSSEHPSAAVDAAGNIHVVWVELAPGSPEIFYKMSDGTAWGPEQQLTSGSAGAEAPCIATDDSGHLHLVWRDYRNGAWGIYYKRFDGLVWSEDLLLTAPGSYPRDPCVGADESLHIHVVWDDYRDINHEIYYKRFDGVWGPDQRITNDPGMSVNPSLAIGGQGMVHVCWKDDRNGTFQVYHKSFNGVTWSGDERISDTPGDSGHPVVSAGDSGKVYVAWYSGYVHYIMFDGNSWVSHEVFTDGRNPAIELDVAGNVHIAYYRKIATRNTEIYWTWNYNGIPPKPSVTSLEPDSAYTDDYVGPSEIRGSSFIIAATVRLEKSGEPSIAAEGVVVETSEIITCTFRMCGVAPGVWDLIVENPGGLSDTLVSALTVLPTMWSEALPLTDDPGSSRLSKSNAHSMAIDPLGHLHLVWEDDRDGNKEIYYKMFDGTSWGPDTRLTTAELPSYEAALAADVSGNLHVVWRDGRDGNDEIYYKRCDSTGVWGPDVRLTIDSGEALEPMIAADDTSGLHVVWADDRYGDRQIMYKHFNGTTWEDDVRLPYQGQKSGAPSVEVDASNNLHVVWHDYNYANSEIYYTMFDGSSWQDTIRLTNDAAESWTPSIAADAANNLHVVWHDERDGNYEIYYKCFDGYTWGPDERVTHQSAVSGNVSLGLDKDDHVHIAWKDYASGDYGIYYSTKYPSGWADHEVIHCCPGYSQDPTIVVDQQYRLHVVWEDECAGNWDIYYSTKAIDELARVPLPEISKPDVVLASIAPNPLREFTRVRFRLGSKAKVRIRIYDITGRLIWGSGPRLKGPGFHEAVWKATDIGGKPVSAGVYFIRIEVGDTTSSAKVVVIR